MPHILKEPLCAVQRLLYLDILWSTTVRDARSSPALLLKLFSFHSLCQFASRYRTYSAHCDLQEQNIFFWFVSECRRGGCCSVFFFLCDSSIISQTWKNYFPHHKDTKFCLLFLLCSFFLIAGEQKHSCKRSQCSYTHCSLIHLLIQSCQVPMLSLRRICIQMPAQASKTWRPLLSLS